MPTAPSPAQRAASRTNGARSRGPATAVGKVKAARNGTRHGLRGGPLALLPSEDAEELVLLRAAVAADWRPRDAYERHWAEELVGAMWRQGRLRGLEMAALVAAGRESPLSEASLKRLVTFARYGARIDKDIGRALDALRVLKRRADADLAEAQAGTAGPDPRASHPREGAVEPAPPVSRTAARTPEPERPAVPTVAGRPAEAVPADVPSTVPLNRRERRRLQALARKAAVLRQRAA